MLHCSKPLTFFVKPRDPNPNLRLKIRARPSPTKHLELTTTAHRLPPILMVSCHIPITFNDPQIVELLGIKVKEGGNKK